jgi:hypothetical protein
MFLLARNMSELEWQDALSNLDRLTNPVLEELRDKIMTILLKRAITAQIGPEAFK